MAEYFLPHHVHYCCRGDSLIVLDLHRDDYLLLEADVAATLSAMSNGCAADGESAAIVLRKLASDGLLTEDRNSGRYIAATSVEPAMRSLIELDTMADVRITAGHAWRFVAACTTAAALLRFCRLEYTVRLVARRKARHASRGGVDLGRARELTAVFNALRPLFPLNYVCLYDSLALLEFLARYRVFPTWVYGVRLDPWAAHCWVQEAGFTFNEGVEEAAHYTPIMTI